MVLLGTLNASGRGETRRPGTKAFNWFFNRELNGVSRTWLDVALATTNFSIVNIGIASGRLRRIWHQTHVQWGSRIGVANGSPADIFKTGTGCSAAIIAVTECRAVIRTVTLCRIRIIIIEVKLKRGLDLFNVSDPLRVTSFQPRGVERNDCQCG